MRASRLVALLLLLQRRGGATADALADELEVSVRTIYRDVAALQAAGVPLWTETGPGGGVRLVEGWRTELDGLTGDEASALFLGGGPQVAGELGLGAVLTAAQSKVLSTLPPELRGRAARVRERFLLDVPGWFHHDEPFDELPTVADAVWSGRRIDVRYARRDKVVARRLDPLGLVLKSGTWYLVARHRQDIRTYRIGRIAAVTLLDQRFERPAAFDLATWWSASSADFDRSMLRTVVRIRVSARGAGWLPGVVDQSAALAALAAADVDDEGWRTIDLPVESNEVACHQLLGLGSDVEIVAPPELRRMLADLGRAITERNLTPVPCGDRQKGAR